MKSSRPHIVACLAFCVCARALADDTEFTDFSVVYSAPAECPGQAMFETGVLSRVPKSRVVSPESAKVRFRIELSADTEKTPSLVWIELADGTTIQREVHDAACSEAADSMVVIAAMVLDAYRQRQQAARAEASATPSAAPAPAATPAPRASATPPAPAPAPTPIPVVDRSAPPRRSPSRPRVSVAAGGAWEHAVAPTAPFGATVGVELAWARSSVWSPSARLSALYTATAIESTSLGSADFRLLSGRLDVCPLRLGAPDGPAASACAEFDAGELRGAGRGSTRNARTQSMPWLAAGVAARGQFPLSSWLGLEALAGVRGLMMHDRFLLNPTTVMHDVPAVSVGLGVGLTARLY